MKNKLLIFLATGAYVGLSPVMPGTFGTLWGLGVALLARDAGTPAQALIIASLIAVSVYITNEAANALGQKDPQRIVLDETCGYLVAFFLLPFSVFNLISAFFLFRFFDIVKPWPIRLIENKLPGGFGIVGDDVLAGVYANLCAQAILLGTCLS
ncbi:MAG: phosphatidylglycerophosphatase A [Deltaproteobacteria bacterium]|nr:phosphatidylglycerophosphatase A [Deltaproteobacteria bacterium]